MNRKSSIRVSAYVKGDADTPDYYRIHQYLNSIGGLNVNYHLMLPARLYHKYVPIREHHILIVVVLFLFVYIRTVLALAKDVLMPPDVLVVNRRIMPNRAFFPVWPLLSLIGRNGRTTIIWDFDDDIVRLGECSEHDFQKMSVCAAHIIVTHEHLASLVDASCQSKIIILPTTDGDMYRIVQKEQMKTERLQTLKDNVILVWVATSLNLPFLESAIGQLDQAAETVSNQKGKTLILKVVCNAPLKHQCRHLKVENIKWTRDVAIESMCKAHIGIMPLLNTEIAHGKGGFKLVQYLSVGLPCIATDIGYNHKVVNASCGQLIPPDSPGFWTEAIMRLSDKDTWLRSSECAFRTWEENFSFEKNLAVWEHLLYGKNI